MLFLGRNHPRSAGFEPFGGQPASQPAGNLKKVLLFRSRQPLFLAFWGRPLFLGPLLFRSRPKKSTFLSHPCCLICLLSDLAIPGSLSLLSPLLSPRVRAAGVSRHREKTVPTYPPVYEWLCASKKLAHVYEVFGVFTKHVASKSIDFATFRQGNSCPGPPKVQKPAGNAPYRDGGRAFPSVACRHAARATSAAQPWVKPNATCCGLKRKGAGGIPGSV